MNLVAIREGDLLTEDIAYLFTAQKEQKVFDRRIAVDTETTGLDPHRDQLSLIQIADAQGNVFIVKRPDLLQPFKPRNLISVLSSMHHRLIMHHAQFDLSFMMLQAEFPSFPDSDVFDTYLASKIVRTYAQGHSLKDNLAEMLGIKLDKGQQTSFWGSKELTEAQITYSAGDVIHLHKLADKLYEQGDAMGRTLAIEAANSAVTSLAYLKTQYFPIEGLFIHGRPTNG